jgi:putative transposase
VPTSTLRGPLRHRQLAGPDLKSVPADMTKAKHSGAFKGHRFPPEIIAYAVLFYFQFPLSLRDVEDLLAARSIIVSYETIRKRVGKFGTKYAASIRRDQPAPSDKWHLDEVVIPIRGHKF